jgi:hypothetical protein
MATTTQTLSFENASAYMSLGTKPDENNHYYWEVCIQNERRISSGCEGRLLINDGRVVPAPGYGGHGEKDYIISVWCGGYRGHDSYRATLSFIPELEDGNKLRWTLTIVNEDKGGETTISGCSTLN